MKEGCQFSVVVAVSRDLGSPPRIYNPKIDTLFYSNKDKREALTVFLLSARVPLLVLRLLIITMVRFRRGRFVARCGPAERGFLCWGLHSLGEVVGCAEGSSMVPRVPTWFRRLPNADHRWGLLGSGRNGWRKMRRQLGDLPGRETT